MRNIILSVMLLCSIASTAFPRSIDTLPIGINLAGAEFGQTTLPGKLGTDFTYPTVQEIDYYASKGIRVIRIPFRWERMQPVLEGPLDSLQLGYLTSFTDSCAKRNIQVILDMHNFGTYTIDSVDYIINIGKVTRTDLADFWLKMAMVFKDRPNIYAYDLMNEANNMGPQVWLFDAQQVIDAIRSVDMHTTLMISGDRNSSAECWPNCSDELKYLVDPANKLVYDAHCFFDIDGLGYYGITSYDEIGADPYVGVRRAKPFIEWCRANNKQGFIGAFGVPGDDPRWLGVLDTFLHYITTNCVNGTYWAGGAWWGSYPLSIEPDNNGDKPQMAALQKYAYVLPGCEPAGTIITDNNVLTIYIYPNPFSTNLFVDQGNCNSYTSVTIYDMLGKQVYFNHLGLNKNTYDLSFLQQGMYVIKLRDDKNNTYINKIMKLK